MYRRYAVQCVSVGLEISSHEWLWLRLCRACTEIESFTLVCVFIFRLLATVTATWILIRPWSGADSVVFVWSRVPKTEAIDVSLISPKLLLLGGDGRFVGLKESVRVLTMSQWAVKWLGSASLYP